MGESQESGEVLHAFQCGFLRGSCVAWTHSSHQKMVTVKEKREFCTVPRFQLLHNTPNSTEPQHRATTLHFVLLLSVRRPCLHQFSAAVLQFLLLIRYDLVLFFSKFSILSVLLFCNFVFCFCFFSASN